MEKRTRQLMRQSGKCLWLHADPEVLWQRISDAQTSVPRPPLTELDPQDEIRHLLAERQPVYADCADYDIDTGQLDAHQVADQIVMWWRQVDTR